MGCIQLLDDFRGHTEPRSSIFAVGDDKIDPVSFDDPRKKFADGYSSRFSNNITYKEYFHEDILTRVIGDARLPDDGHFDLPGISQLRFDLLDDVLTKHHRIVIGDLLVLHEDADFPSRLDGKTSINTAERISYIFKFLQTFDVALQHLS